MSGRHRQVFKNTMLQGNDENDDPISYWCTSSSTNDLYKAHCLICDIEIDVGQRGRSALSRHGGAASHISASARHRDSDKKLKQLKRTQTLLTSSIKSSSSKSAGLSLNEKIVNAEAMFCTSLAVCNIPANVCDTMVPSFSSMFPDSEIAKGMQMKRNKATRILSDGLGPHFKSLVENEIRNTALAYTLEIDETTTAKHWRQLDVLARYYSEENESVVVYHLSSVTLGRVNHKLLYQKLADVATPLYTKKLLQISTDGPNVMKALTKEAKKKLNPDLVDIDTCNIHKVHNAFCSAYDKFGNDVESLGLELYYFFSDSSVRREDFEKVQEKLEIKKHIFLRHVPSRWLTIEDVTKRLLEQYPALREYFLRSRLISDSEKRKNSRIKKLVEILNNKVLLPEILFMKSAMPIFTRVTRMLQSEAPLIHVLHDELSTLILTLLRRFVTEKEIGEARGLQLCEVTYQSSANHLKRPYIGHDCLKSLASLKAEGKINEEEFDDFLDRAKTFYIDVVSLLLKKLPLNNPILPDLQALHPLPGRLCGRLKLCDVWLLPSNYSLGTKSMLSLMSGRL